MEEILYTRELTRGRRRFFNDWRFHEIHRATSSLSLRSAKKLGHFPSTGEGEIGRLADIKKKATPFSLPSNAPFATSAGRPSRPKKPRTVIKHSSSLLDGDSQASLYIKHVHY